jgi:hypothetical protein
MNRREHSQLAPPVATLERGLTKLDKSGAHLITLMNGSGAAVAHMQGRVRDMARRLFLPTFEFDMLTDYKPRCGASLGVGVSLRPTAVFPLRDANAREYELEMQENGSSPRYWSNPYGRR